MISSLPPRSDPPCARNLASLTHWSAGGLRASPAPRSDSAPKGANRGLREPADPCTSAASWLAAASPALSSRSRSSRSSSGVGRTARCPAAGRDRPSRRAVRTAPVVLNRRRRTASGPTPRSAALGQRLHRRLRGDARIRAPPVARPAAGRDDRQRLRPAPGSAAACAAWPAAAAPHSSLPGSLAKAKPPGDLAQDDPAPALGEVVASSRSPSAT
jgi:hypothetical protein